jgi:hypothetical protein
MDWSMVDWSMIGTAVAFAVGGGGAIGLWTHHADRVEKRQERQLSRRDAYRAELVQAHAAFIGAFTKALNAESRLAVCIAVSGIRPLDEKTKSIKASAEEDLHNAELEAEVRLAVVLLIEDNLAVVERLREMQMLLGAVGPVDADHFDEWRADYGRRRQALAEFLMTMATSLSVKSWDGERRIATVVNDVIRRRHESPNSPPNSDPVAQRGLGDSEGQQ